MKPIVFPKALSIFGTDQKEYLPLPAYRHKDDWRCVSSCWGMSLKDRIKVLFTGKVWVTMPTFGNALNPVKLSTDEPDWNE